MTERVILLSGSISSGKSTLATALCDRFHLRRINTKDIIASAVSLEPSVDRRTLQRAGEDLDRKSKGAWLAQELSRQWADLSPGVVVDSVRLQSQIEAVRSAFGRRVVHIHLEAPDDTLRKRFRTRKAGRVGEVDYEDAKSDSTEQAVPELSREADVVIDTRRCSKEDVVVRAATRLGLYAATSKLVDVLIGGQYGSEGKGNIAAYLAPGYDLLVRVGGPNAGHKVITETGEVFTHHHLPSGTRTSDAKLVLGPGAVIRVVKLLEEIAECGVDYERLAIDPQAMIIGDEDIEREAGLVKTIGSTGQGVGAATARRVLERDQKTQLARDISQLRPYIRPAVEVLDGAFAAGSRVFLEGTQGTGLSLFHGDYPHVTSRDTTVNGCLAEAGIAQGRVRRVVMVCRTYPIRVQSPKGSTSGAISQEISWAEVARRSGLPYRQILATEKTSTTGRQRRVGEFDWDLLRKASMLNGPTDIALTFADYLDAANASARRFEQLADDTIRFIEEVERVARANVSLISTRFHYRGVVDRRSW